MKAPEQRKRAVGYCRVSTKKQDISLEAQEEQIRAMAVVKGWDLVDMKIDRDEFSGDLDRPGLEEVLEMVKNQAIDAVIFAKLDRLSRSTRDVILLMDLFNKKGVGLVSLAENLDTKSSMGRFFVRMIASLAELEREMIGDRTRTGMQHLIKLGMPTGNPRYGFRAQQKNRHLPLSEKKPVVPEPVEQEIVQLVHELRRQGYKLREIADKLNERGFKTRVRGKIGGKPFRLQYVDRILKLEQAVFARPEGESSDALHA